MPEHDRHPEHAGGSVRERGGVAVGADAQEEGGQGCECPKLSKKSPKSPQN